MSKLILIRHGRSEWNDKGLWTGWTDVSLSEEGKLEAARSADSIKDLKIDAVFVSKLKRVQQTVDIIMKKLDIKAPVVQDAALNEKSYGIYTGKNKWEVKEQVGEEEFRKIRRDWDHPIPEGESLKMVYERVVPFYEKSILPVLKSGKNALVGGSGNSLRALVKFLDSIPDDKISDLEITTGEIYVYDIDEKTGKVLSKQILAKNEKKV